MNKIATTRPIEPDFPLLFLAAYLARRIYAQTSEAIEHRLEEIATERVDRGIASFESKPDWRLQLGDATTLNIGSLDKCPMKRMYGDYDSGLAKHFGGLAWIPLYAVYLAVRHAFCPTFFVNSRRLNRIWRNRLAAA
ncbi:MAG: hypothetical protein JO019_04380 [Candidatus Kaiserbacteria bacterium]|nr:hypothetical protein [Candidatus Kaiserbacteria bacterium]